MPFLKFRQQPVSGTSTIKCLLLCANQAYFVAITFISEPLAPGHYVNSVSESKISVGGELLIAQQEALDETLNYYQRPVYSLI